MYVAQSLARSLLDSMLLLMGSDLEKAGGHARLAPAHLYTVLQCWQREYLMCVYNSICRPRNLQRDAWLHLLSMCEAAGTLMSLIIWHAQYQVFDPCMAFD